jgi:hypothetical protein
MRLRSGFLSAIVFALVIGFPSVALAGPMDWTYTSRFHAVGQPGVPFIFIADGGARTDGSYELGAALHGLMESGYPSNPGAGPLVSVGHFEMSQFNSAYQIAPTFEKNFQLDVRITDATSGQSGTAVFFGFGNTVFTEDWIPNPISLEFSSPTSRSLVIGANRYTVQVSTDGAAIYDGNAGVVARVDVQPATTPEPATVGLAGIGFVAMFGWRRLRK